MTQSSKAEPRLANGNKLYSMGRGYFVCVDRANREVSDRAWGDLWVGVARPRELAVILSPDSTGADGLVRLTPTGRFVGFAMCTEEGEIADVGYLPAGGAGADVRIDWTPGLRHMA